MQPINDNYFLLSTVAYKRVRSFENYVTQLRPESDDPSTFLRKQRQVSRVSASKRSFAKKQKKNEVRQFIRWSDDASRSSRY